MVKVDYIHQQYTQKQRETHAIKVREFFEWCFRELGESFTEQEAMRLTQYDRFTVKRYVADGIQFELCNVVVSGREAVCQIV